MKMTQKHVETLVYLDLEATGLPSSGKPRISEICLLAIKSTDVLELHKEMMILKDKQVVGDQVERLLVPRVVNKLVLCVYPMATIMPGVSRITGLDNYNLSGQGQFDNSLVDSLVSFLGRLPPPVCLVAHNGTRFDFPLLRAELARVGRGLGVGLLCCDSYTGIREVIEERMIEQELREVEDLVEAGEFDTEMIVNEVATDNSVDVMKTPVRNSSVLMTPPSSARKRTQEMLATLDITPTTPNSLKGPLNKISRWENESTPSKTPVSPSTPVSQPREGTHQMDVGKARKRLPFSGASSKPRPLSYSLVNLHTRLVGQAPLFSHGAEADCLSLMRTTAALGQDWLNWVGGNMTMFKEGEKMWGNTKKES